MQIRSQDYECSADKQNRSFAMGVCGDRCCGLHMIKTSPDRCRTEEVSPGTSDGVDCSFGFIYPNMLLIFSTAPM